MALHFHTSNKLEILIDIINRNMQQHSGSDIFQSDWIIVPNSGIATYLQQQLALRNGICANLKIRKIAEFYNQTVTAEERVRPNALRWKLFAYFVTSTANLPREVTDYLNQGGGNDLELRAWQLSGRLLQIFDQYRTFRYDKLAEILTHDNWQSSLFKYVFGENLSKRLQALNNLKSYQSNTPDILHIFGFGSMPKLYLDFIYNLARMENKELFFYYLAPSMEFFGDQYFNRGGKKFIPQNFTSEEVLNPLFSAWGAQALGLLELTLNGQDVIETFDD
ncbi:MAG: exodeoxyribonuclease V subunit gamma, partial [Victivallaceae bacterium]